VTARIPFFRLLVWCFLGSFAFLVTASYLHLSPWKSLALGIAPLIAYHWILARRAREGLTPAAVDSVYYFGFLVTIAALGLSAARLAGGEDGDVSKIIAQFGIGLIATGYAVLARMHLNSLARVTDDEDADVLIDRSMKRAVELVSVLEDAVVRTSDFSKVVATQTTQVTESAHRAIQASLSDTARVFAKEINSTLALTRDGLFEIHGLVADSSFAALRVDLVRSLREVLDTSTRLNKALGDYANRIDSMRRSADAAASRLGNLEDGIQRLTHGIEHLSGPDGAISRAAVPIGAAAEALARSSAALAGGLDRLPEFVEAVTDAGPTFQQIKTNAERMHDQLELLSAVIARFEEALASIATTSNKADEVSQQIQAGVTGIGASLDSARRALAEFAEGMAVTLDAFGRSSSTIGASMTETARVLGQDVQRSAQAVTQLTDRLVEVAQIVIDRTRQRQDERETV